MLSHGVPESLWTIDLNRHGGHHSNPRPYRSSARDHPAAA